ncbi:MAG: hypothetical protein Q7S05_04505 [bacterium]|nr:hypothetical protein [bacterium]
MNIIFLKIFAVALLFVGEILPVSAEVWAAKLTNILHLPFLEAYPKTVFVHILGSFFLIAGYIIGYKAFQNIWIVNVITISAIVIITPVATWLLIQQPPTAGAWTGLVLGFGGLIAATFF